MSATLPDTTWIPTISASDGREFTQCTTSLTRQISGAFYPENINEIKELVSWARHAGQKLWPVSTGKNWGYGTALPAVNHCHIVCLKKLTGIRDFNPYTGVITIEPGVTQQALCDYLKDTQYLAPVTGAGPDTSVLGNLLERGYGLAPLQDHFSALLSLKAVLGNGKLYESPLQGIVGKNVDNAFKWGIGPYLDGLFAQSNFGIVTEVTIQLGRRSHCQRLARLAIDDDQLPSVVTHIQQILQDYPGIISGINLMNRERVNAMGVNNPPDWTAIFAVSACNKDIVNSAYKAIKSRLKPHSHIMSINTRWLKYLEKLPLTAEYKQHVEHARAVDSILNGTPTKMALNLTYLKNPIAAQQRTYDPAEDGCGLIWYSPLVEMAPRSVEQYIAHVRTTCKLYNIEPLITLTSLSARCFDSTVPVLYDKKSKSQTTSAQKCFEMLLKLGKERGYYPYRLPVSAMKNLISENPEYFQHVGQIKKSLDPDNVIAPGRYSAI